MSWRGVGTVAQATDGVDYSLTRVLGQASEERIRGAFFIVESNSSQLTQIAQMIDRASCEASRTLFFYVGGRGAHTNTSPHAATLFAADVSTFLGDRSFHKQDQESESYADRRGNREDIKIRQGHRLPSPRLIQDV